MFVKATKSIKRLRATDNVTFSPRIQWLAVCALGVNSVATTVSWAQTAPNAGVLQQQIEREQQGAAQRLQLQPPAKPLAEPPLVGQTVVVQAFKFKGNTLLSDEQLSAALAVDSFLKLSQPEENSRRNLSHVNRIPC
jgi:hypothetical protein